MKTYPKILTFIPLALLTMAAGTNPALAASPETKTKSLHMESGTLTRVEIAGNLHVELTQGSGVGYRMELDARLEPYLTAEVHDNTLVLRLTGIPHNLQNGSTQATVTVSGLEELKVTAGATVQARGSFTGKECRITSTAGSDVNDLHWTGNGPLYITATAGSDVEGVQVERNSLIEINATGGSDVSLRCTTEHLSATLSGGSDLRAEGYARLTEITCSGGSDAYLRDLTAETVQVKKSSGGDIYGPNVREQ